MRRSHAHRLPGDTRRRALGLVAGGVAVAALAVLSLPSGFAANRPSGPTAVSPASPTEVIVGDPPVSGAPARTPSVSTPPLRSSVPPEAVQPTRSVDHFGLGLPIADRDNGRLLIVNQAKQVLWRFPVRGSLPSGQGFSADDAFLAPDARTIVANDEAHNVIDRIDIVTHKVVWQYGPRSRCRTARLPSTTTFGRGSS